MTKYTQTLIDHHNLSEERIGHVVMEIMQSEELADKNFTKFEVISKNELPEGGVEYIFTFGSDTDYDWKLDACKSITELLTPVKMVAPAEEIEKPSRYNKGSIEVWDFILDQGMGFLEGNIIKYIARFKQKNGIEDLKKARVYLDKLIKEEESK